MPLFEYECRACGHRFEYLTRDGQSPVCPACDGKELQKLLSTFAVAASDGAGVRPRAAAGPCGMCCDPSERGSCPMN